MHILCPLLPVRRTIVVIFADSVRPLRELRRIVEVLLAPLLLDKFLLPLALAFPLGLPPRSH
jgi:hypothetical protein